MSDELIKAELENLQIVVSKQNKRIQDLKEWITRALRLKSAIQWNNEKKLRRIRLIIEILIKELQGIEIDRFKKLGDLLAQVQELLGELNFYI